jgi:sigma-E factor negative regulatory protein RseA
MEMQMDTHKKIREHISALCDGALPETDRELAFAALRLADGEQAWAVYHHIGDALRAQASVELSTQFGTRLAERLAAEPALSQRRTVSVAPALAAASAPEPVVAASS